MSSLSAVSDTTDYVLFEYLREYGKIIKTVPALKLGAQLELIREKKTR
jgi:hypothetical protein